MFHINEVRHHTHLQGTWYFKFRWPPNSCVKESCSSKGLSSLAGSVVHPVWIAFLGFGGLCHVEVPICCSVFELCVCVCERERERAVGRCMGQQRKVTTRASHSTGRKGSGDTYTVEGAHCYLGRQVLTGLS